MSFCLMLGVGILGTVCIRGRRCCAPTRAFSSLVVSRWVRWPFN